MRISARSCLLSFHVPQFLRRAGWKDIKVHVGGSKLALRLASPRPARHSWEGPWTQLYESEPFARSLTVGPCRVLKLALALLIQSIVTFRSVTLPDLRQNQKPDGSVGRHGFSV